MTSGFKHEALLYRGDREFTTATAAFLREAVALDEPALVVVASRKIRLLQEALGKAAAHIRFADMATVGANPALIIPAWQDWAEANAGRRFRGIGEPIDTTRDAATLEECQVHERLLNDAFDDSGDWWLLCPYDVEEQPADVIDEAHRSHATVWDGKIRKNSSRFLGAGAGFDRPFPPPPSEASQLAFGPHDLAAVRAFVARKAAAFGLRPDQVEDLVLAANEIANNSIQHGSGHGVVRAWYERADVACDIEDGGRISDPLADRRRPSADVESARGLWLANQLCDLVQLRRTPTATIVRLRMRRKSAVTA
jgi:anti-sigma regulatory factor (Ser/Thr protein kinase)